MVTLIAHDEITHRGLIYLPLNFTIMKHFVMNGITFTDFGANNYTDGMHLVSVCPMPTNMIEDVLNGKYPGIYLNPSQPCLYTFFGVFGTSEQYEVFYNHQKDSQIAKAIFAEIGFDCNDENLFDEVKRKCTLNSKDWWAK